MNWHPLLGSLLGVIAAGGVLFCGSSIHVIRQWERVRSLSLVLGDRHQSHSEWSRFRSWLVEILSKHPRSPWLSDVQVERSMRQAMTGTSVHAFRQSQILAAAIASLASLMWCVLKVVAGEPLTPLGVLFICAGAFIAGGWLARWNLRREASQRLTQIELELPTMTDLMAFAVSAGEPIAVALRRLCNSCSGEFVRELRRIDAGLASGVALVVALQSMAKDLEVPAVSRLVRAITAALERGTPMAEVLRAQASDSRAEATRNLLVEAGKKETAMMIPVVFIILPIIVAVALYPGLVELNILHS